MENKMRTTLNEIYFGKTKDIINDLRSVGSLNAKGQQQQLAKELLQNLQSRQK
jgi:capping protein beta